ncbi:TonB-dependent receptor [Dysgonomonas sp. HDW5B]|nr:TonB-dependent receptor [Dysgonomonas sp. HDW5B]
MKETRLTSTRRISMKFCLLLFLIFSASISNAFAQTTVTGVVTDEQKDPLPGVSVTVKGSTTGTVTDFDGNYSVTVKSGDVLEFTFLGMKPQSIPVGSKTKIDVVLIDDTHELETAIVIGYGTAKKRDLTGSIVTVKGDDVFTKPASNPLASIQGKVAGVQVINTGKAGQDPEIRIRGTNSINGYKPLYVVDGLFNDNINFLNPADIESMEILKDPSSLAIFGVRGANGVIIINTKRAKEGQTLVNINTAFGFKQVVDKIKMTNAPQFKELYNEQLVNQGDKPYDFTDWQANTNWQDEIFQTGFMSNSNVSVTGSTDKSKFYLGVGYASEEGNIKHEKFGKVTVNLSSDYNLTKDIKVGFQFNGARMTPADQKSVLKALYAAPVAPVFNEEFQLYHALPSFQKAQIENPMVDISARNNTTKALNYRGGGNVYGEVNFLKNFNFKAMFALDYRSDDSRKYTPIIAVYDPSIGGPNPIDTLGTKKTSVQQIKVDETKIQADYVLTYTNKINDHNITATAGFTTFYNSLTSLTAERGQGEGLPIPNNPDKWYVSMGDPSTSKTESEQWERSTVSFLLRALYSYKNKYLFNGSFRRDGSSAFFYTGNQWQNFYSVGGGWVMSEEDFMQNQSVIDFLKIKGSWGTLGNQNMSTPYPAQPLLTNETSAIFGTPSVEYPSYSLKYIPNPNLRWEKIEAWEAGFEMNMLANRLRLESVYYKKNTKDLLAEIPGIAGTTPGLGNLGEIQNKGFEVVVSWNDKINSDWGYSISGNLTTIDNKVKSLVQDGYTIIKGDKNISHTTAGYPIGFFYGYTVDGVYQSDADIANSPKNTLTTVKPGDLKFKDMDGDGKITTADRGMIGNPTPDFTYGISLGLNYKNFDLGVDLMGVYGNEIYRTWDNYNWSQFNYMSHRLDRWHGEGTSNSEPILNTTRTINNENSTYYIEDGSFFRIRNIQVGYTFDQNALKKVRVKALKVFINAQNLKTWKNNTGYTPELGGDATAFGIDNGSYPMPAIYTFGLNLTF